MSATQFQMKTQGHTAMQEDAACSPLLSVRGLKTHFGKKKRFLDKNAQLARAVDGIDLDIFRGETLGLVGESGCGKSTLGRSILGLVPATDGSIRFKDQELVGLSESALRPLRKNMQLVFQNPYSSLNPRMTVRESLEAPLKAFHLPREGKVERIMEDVGLSLDFLDRFPHEFSGGQRQRIAIARALILEPGFVVCDEPVSALDVSVRAQILNLLKKLQQEHGLTYLFISHDLSVVKHSCDRVAVMYLGKIVEIASADELFSNPLHPYTRALLSAIPLPSPDAKRERVRLTGEVPSLYDIPKACSFQTRCPNAADSCKEETPALEEIKPGHFCRCACSLA